MSEKSKQQEFLRALALVARADGVVTDEERSGIVSVAKRLGVEDSVTAFLDSPFEPPPSIEDISADLLDYKEKIFLYSAAAYISRLDGKQQDEEVAVLQKLAIHFGLDADDIEGASKVAEETLS